MRTLIRIVPVLLCSAAAAQGQGLTAARLDDDVLRLQVSDRLETVRHFELPAPPRVVLDLFGIDGARAEMPAPAAGSAALEVRTGEHPNFLRVVVDLNEALPGYQVRRDGDLVEVGLGLAALPPSSTGVLIASSPAPVDPSRPPRATAPAAAIAAPATAAPEPAPAAAPTPAVDAAPSPVVTPSPVAEGAVPAAAMPAERTPSTAFAAADEAAPEGLEYLENLSSMSTDELLALIEAELAGLDQKQSAEELIDQVEAVLDENQRRRALNRSRSPREPPIPPEWRRPRIPPPSPPSTGDSEQLPFRYVDEPATPPATDDGDNFER